MNVENNTQTQVKSFCNVFDTTQVVSVYMFHELPENVRDMAAKEMFRVLKPGGLCVFCDSVQLGDRPEWNESMSAFSEW